MELKRFCFFELVALVGKLEQPFIVLIGKRL